MRDMLDIDRIQVDQGKAESLRREFRHIQRIHFARENELRDKTHAGYVSLALNRFRFLFKQLAMLHQGAGKRGETRRRCSSNHGLGVSYP